MIFGLSLQRTKHQLTKSQLNAPIDTSFANEDLCGGKAVLEGYVSELRPLTEKYELGLARSSDAHLTCALSE